MKTEKIIPLMLVGLFLLPAIGCEKKEETKTVDWYMAPENKAVFEAKLKECRNNPAS